MTTNPYNMDHRLLKVRRKSIYELRPDLLWDANTLQLSNESLVASWVDRRQGAALAQASNDYKPTYATHGLSNRPSVLFSGDEILTATFAASLAASTSHTITAIVENLGTTGVRTLFCAYDASDASNYYLKAYLDTDGNVAFQIRHGGSIYGARSSAALSEGAHTITFTYLDANWQFYVDDVASEMVAIGAGSNGESFAAVSGLDTMQMGVFGTSTQWVGWISLLAIWGKTL